jgi:hypothetical protein
MSTKANSAATKRFFTTLSLAVIMAGTQTNLPAQCTSVCPPMSFLSNVNFAGNPDLEAAGPCGLYAWIANGGGNCILAGVPWSAAQLWRLHGDNLARPVQSWWEPSTLPIGGMVRMLHIKAQGNESGVYQPFVMPVGANSVMFSVWVKVITGHVIIGTNAMVNVGPYAWSTKTGEWEELRVCTNGSPVNMLFIYNANLAGGEFYVDRFEVKLIN